MKFKLYWLKFKCFVGLHDYKFFYRGYVGTIIEICGRRGCKKQRIKEAP